MASNPLRTSIDALRYAVDFAQMDLDQASPRELMAVQQRLDALLNPDRPRAWRKVPPLDRTTLRALQADVFVMLKEIISRGFVQANLQLTFWAARDLKADARRDARAKQLLGAYVSTVGVLVYGPPRDWLLYRIIRLLEEVGAERLLVCPAPDCERLFLKITRKEFCSTTCQSRVYMRGYRKQLSSARKKEHGRGKATRQR